MLNAKAIELVLYYLIVGSVEDPRTLSGVRCKFFGAQLGPKLALDGLQSAVDLFASVYEYISRNDYDLRENYRTAIIGVTDDRSRSLAV